MNTNYWFNKNVGNPRNDVQLNQFGARVGGPIVIPGVLRRQRQGVLLLPLRTAAPAEQRVAHPHGAAAGRAQRIVQVQRDR
jgi:hypothetical protein